MRRMTRVGSKIPLPVRALAVLACAGALAACSESLPTTAPASSGGGSGAQVNVIGGQSFQLAITDTDYFPLRVRVVDANGRPIPSATVKYNVVVGQGIFSADSTLTNDQGFTQVQFKPLSVGTVIAEARFEGSGGTSRQTITFQVLHDPKLGASMERVSGNGQIAAVGTVLPEPLVVRILNPDGLPVEGFGVTFGLTSPDSVSQLIDPVSGATGSQVTILTGADGFARAQLQLGSSPREYRVTATAVFEGAAGGAVETATFTASATLEARAAVKLLAISGERQTVILGTADSTDPTQFTPFENPEQPNPLVVQALDRFGNGVPGVTIFWHVTDGTGALSSFATTTDAGGYSLNVISDVSLGRNLVDAVASSTNRVTFVIEGISTSEPEAPRPGPDASGPSN